MRSQARSISLFWPVWTTVSIAEMYTLSVGRGIMSWPKAVLQDTTSRKNRVQIAISVRVFICDSPD
ncbi:MAG: hypothetical protein DRI46_08075 [Chloroflexi bacterium]|nr:MAG: hypothetical protein DRI46_08075 [Chloroflexota bacterium]